MRKTIMRYLVGVLMIHLPFLAIAQEVSRENIQIEKELISDSEIRLKKVTNNSGSDVRIKIKNSAGKLSHLTDIQKGKSHNCDIECVSVRAEIIGQGATHGGGSTNIWNATMTKDEWTKAHPVIQTSNTGKQEIEKTSKAKSKVEVKEDRKEIPQIVQEVKKTDGTSIINAFIQRLEQDLFWSDASVNAYIKEIKDHIDFLGITTDREQYITAKKLNKLIKEKGGEIKEYKKNIDKKTEDFLKIYNDYKIESNFDYKDSIRHILEEKLSRREEATLNLKDVIDSNKETESFDVTKLDKSAFIQIGVIGLIIIILLAALKILSKKKKQKNKQVNIQQVSANNASPSIVVRRKTTSILKKQSLDDVIGNQAYLKVECTDFCGDSAVRRIYIKNTCIKDIYNMYADDLRNPDNPKEDGCMVLGRWVFDKDRNEYDVSLEEIVRPGDDAVFQEYELNFGGKIKLKVAEKLRKLRRETNLQYDLTCWVHSHPGLGVFFSNSDNSVQMQLKHPSHPKFLTAIVVDILTPQQEFGIFTFKHDSSINSANDLRKMYSLEELHKWAVESDRNTYKSDDYFNILSKAESVYGSIQSIQLSNGAIIDISSISTDTKIGLAGWAHGYINQYNGKNILVVNSVSKEDKSHDDDLLGCMVIGTLCSIPSIKKAISDYLPKIKFVMFYSVKDETITTIPVINMELSMSDKYCTEEKIEDLKIWTRRKR